MMDEKLFKFFRCDTVEYDAIGSFLNDCGVGYELVENQTDATNETVIEKSIFVVNDEDNIIDSDYVFDEIGVVIESVNPSAFELN